MSLAAQGPLVLEFWFLQKQGHHRKLLPGDGLGLWTQLQSPAWIKLGICTGLRLHRAHLGDLSGSCSEAAAYIARRGRAGW